MADRGGLRTGEVAERAGVNVETLRYYERRGLLAQPARSIGGHRTYPPEPITLLAIIKAAQRLGFTLGEVAELMDTGRRRHPTPDLQARARSKPVEIERKVSDLRAIHGRLEEIVAARCDSLTNCTCPACPMPFADLADPDGAAR
ncbi:MerR family transcriptional regulator [Micromonospora sp. WMMD812]|uniref:MerR family transcriptional regulator n=1 Tax=Micromonospora sp. WMMD812 TaxID=3015152 RepID=UPI00248C0653|nr:MerR family transcriptional regulator [Micromonospora sp. WMMD812]WBB69044.1 MerR family transcriptional regulator [Micromonospora sp. WMMD812]